MKTSKMIALALVAVMLLTSLVGCGSNVYEDVAGTYDGYYKETTNEGFEKTNQVIATLTLNADKTYSYELEITNTIYGSLIFGKAEVTVTGTYEAVEKSEGIYTVTLSEAKTVTGPISAPKDLYGISGTRDDTLTEFYTLTIEDTKVEEFGLGFISQSKSFDVDTTIVDDVSFEDASYIGVDFMMPFAALQNAYQEGVAEGSQNYQDQQQ